MGQKGKPDETKVAAPFLVECDPSSVESSPLSFKACATSSLLVNLDRALEYL